MLESLTIVVAIFSHLRGFVLEGRQSVHVLLVLTQAHLTQRSLLMYEEHVGILYHSSVSKGRKCAEALEVPQKKITLHH